jgi:hypothetical protein
MAKKIVWNGKPYNSYRRKDGTWDYFRHSTSQNRSTYLHRDMWEDAFGPIPEGCEIHHKDFNRSHNWLGNFECLTVAEHDAIKHPRTKKQIARQLEHLEKIRPLTKAWHASKEGRAKHREIGALTYRDFVPTAKPCAQCSTTFLPRKIGNQDRFCSNACKSAWRRDSGVDNVERICPECSAKFTVSKYSDKKCCSHSCAMVVRHRNKREK